MVSCWAKKVSVVFPNNHALEHVKCTIHVCVLLYILQKKLFMRVHL